jgi:Rps23 Pro-64 3,4-dihydroxylase Tpa1-like proline 4-hydroxylase
MSVVDVYDNVLEDHVAEFIDMQMKELSWRYDYKSQEGKPGLHWHILCGHNPKAVVEKGYEWVQPIWDTAKFKYDFKEKYGLIDYIRVYMNAHTFGLHPHWHADDGDFTMIYYPRLDWEKHWGGGTMIEGSLGVNEYVEYVPNRLIIFNANLRHQAQPVARECYELRSVIVFKCNVDVRMGGLDAIQIH